MTEQAVVVDELTIRYGDRTAVDALSLEARFGEVVALLGPNGAGKTSTIETLEGYRRPTAGRVRVLGLDPISDRDRVVPQLGVMLQDGGVATGIRVQEVVDLYAAYYPDPRDPDELIERLGLAEVRRSTWRRLSGGERQRVSLALALVGQPRVAFLDEPTSGVDVAGRQVIRDVIRELRDGGTCVVLASHELDEVERVADRIAVVDRGRLLAYGTMADLTAGDEQEICFVSDADLDVASLAAHVGAAVRVDPPDADQLGVRTYRLATEGTPAQVAAVTSWLAEHDHPIAGLRTDGASLEEVFLRLTAAS